MRAQAILRKEAERERILIPPEGSLVYNAGPAACKFHLDNSKIRAIRGPIRSGKSVSACVEGKIRGGKQHPCIDGVRKTRLLVVRNTYGQLSDTTIKTFLTWLHPDHYGRFRENPYPNYDMYWEEDGHPAHMEVWFRALDRPEHLRNLLSMEYTFFYANEVRELQLVFIKWLESRAGQYPPRFEKPPEVPNNQWPTWYGGWMDTNSPDEVHWYYDLFEKKINPEDPDGEYDPAMAQKYSQHFFPREENEHNLPPGYYDDLRVGATPEFIKVYIDGDYGFVVEGKAVYKEYSDPYHCRGNYDPIRGIEIIRGWDIGNTMHPACIFAQQNQGLEVFDEAIGTEIGIHRFKERVISHCAKFYPDFEFRDYGDPAMSSAASGDVEERTVQEIFAAGEHGIDIFPGEVSFVGRREAVNNLLMKTIPADGPNPVRPFFRLARRCKFLRAGFKGRYQYPEIGNSGRYHKDPLKDIYADAHDGLQYLVTGLYRPYDDKHETARNKYRPRRAPSAMAA